MNGPDLIAHKRGLIVTSFAAIEAKIGQYIMLQIADSSESQLIFNELIIPQPLFSFELKKKIFFDLLRRNGSYGSFPKRQLEDMQKMRNIAAHGATTIDNPFEANDLSAYRVEHGGHEYMIDQLEADYSTARNVVLPALLELAPGQPLPERSEPS